MEPIINLSQLVQVVAVVAVGVALARDLILRKSRGTVWLLVTILTGVVGSTFSLVIDIAGSDAVVRFAGTAATFCYAMVPGALYAFTRVFHGRHRALDATAVVATIAFMAGSLIFPARPLSVRAGGTHWYDGEMACHAYFVALGLYSAWLMSLVAVRLWRVGGGPQSRVVRMRMRCMSTGVFGLAMSAAIADIFPSGNSEVIGNVIGTLGALLLAISFWVPRSVRLSWQFDGWSRISPVVRALIDGSDAEEVAAITLPYIVDLLGAELVTLLRGDGSVRASVEHQRQSSWVGLAVEVEVPLATGSMRFALSPYAPLFGGDEKSMAHVWGALVEMAMDRCEQQARDREESERMREADRVKDTVLAAVGHDLRTPLTVVLGFALTLQQQPDLAATDQRVMIDQIVTSASRLDHILNDVMGLIGIGHGQGLMNVQRTGIRSLIISVIDRSELGEHHLEISGEEVFAEVCPVRMERVFDNLLANVLRHTPAGSNVSVRVLSEDGGATVLIDDDGPGIPEEQHATLFEPFVRGAVNAGGVPGSGLGLSIVSSFVGMHSGRVWVDRSPMGGSRFGVWVPLVGVE